MKTYIFIFPFLNVSKLSIGILISPLGEAPAVVTEACDELTREGKKINKIVVIYTKGVKNSFNLLKIDFIYGPYSNRIELKGEMLPIYDIKTKEDYRIYRKTLLKIIEDELNKDIEIYLSIAGGRKTMSIDSVLVALAIGLDKVYYLSFPKATIETKLLQKTYDFEKYLIYPPPKELLNKIVEICHPKIFEPLLIEVELPKLSFEERKKIREWILSK